jgi:hypothetical protein
MSRKAFIKTLKSRSEVAVTTLELIKKEQQRTQASLKTTKGKYCKTFFTKRESIMRLPKNTALNQMDWPRDSTSP